MPSQVAGNDHSDRDARHRRADMTRDYSLKRRIYATACALLLVPAAALGFSAGLGTQEDIRPDLDGIATGEGWTLANRSATVGPEGDLTVVSFDGRPQDGAAWLDGMEFHNGTIEVLIRGRNNPGRSFVGVAFRGVDDETYDAIYFRPFNFVADNDLSRSHMVQYISHPDHPWSQLRQDHSDVYENARLNPPNPDDFFSARIEISDPEIRVYVGDDGEASLVVDQLSGRSGGRVGLWMGNNSDGSFAELILKPSGAP